MDVHKIITVIVVLNALGQMENHSKVKTKAENICDFFRGLSGKVEVAQAIFRGRGIDPGRAIYSDRERQEWLAKLKDEATRFRAESLLDQLATLQQLRKQAKKRLILQVRQQPDYRTLSSLPGFGPIHVGQLIASVATTHRFRTKRQFWTYCGLAVVTRSSADYKTVEG
jgi:transposase